MNFVLLTLQKISWSSATTGNSGNTWAYSNRQPKATVDFFGQDNDFSVSRIKKGQQDVASSNDELVTIWLNDCDDAEVELYKAEYGEELYIDENNKMQTVADYEELMSQGSDVDEDTTSEQPFAQYQLV